MRRLTVNPEIQTNKRVIVASFVAGIGAMLLVGLIAPVAAMGGLSMTSAEANQLEHVAPAIAPLDVVAIEATLAEAERSMSMSRSVTDGAIHRLERLSGR